MGALIGRFKPGENVPGFATTQVNAGRFVKITDAAGAGTAPENSYPVTHCGSGQRAFGVSEADSGPTTYDANAQARIVNVARKNVARCIAGAAVSAPAEVMSDSVGRAIEFVDGAAGAASLNTGVVGNNNAITWTAVEGGAEGNAITIALVDPAAIDQALAVDVDGNTITVSLATSHVGAITSTATDIIAAIHEHDTASQLVTAANQGASTGAGVVVAVAPTHLAGGTGTGRTVALGQSLTDAAQAGDIIEVALY